jgi:hypothetical protein
MRARMKKTCQDAAPNAAGECGNEGIEREILDVIIIDQNDDS